VDNLTSDPANDWGPLWSPDGAHIAFYSDRDGSTELYVADSDGGNPRNVSRSGDTVRDATWSPDGSGLAYVTGGEATDIYIVDTAGGEARPIAAHPAKDWGPAWSPDGLRLAFLSTREGGSHIYIADVDVGVPVRLTWGLGSQQDVTWEPVGARLTFVSDRYGHADLYMYDANGQALRAITRQADADSAPTWASDGSTLAYVSRIDGNAEIYVASVDGSSVRNISRHALVGSSPCWSPDGSQMAFMSNRDGDTEIYLMGADGGGLLNLTQHPMADGAPSWSPDGQQIAFTTNRDDNWEVYVHTMQQESAWDVNSDGRVDIVDLILVAQTFGMTGDGLVGDVTGNGSVDVMDLVLVASHFGEATALAAPARMPRSSDAAMIEAWIEAARDADDGSTAYRRGVSTLERLLASITPDSTALLRNYPNPFNPETWIPFELSRDATVSITVYDIRGKVVREIDMGFLPAGDYSTVGRAARWDGRNLSGESVGSGVYYAEFRASQFRDIGRLIMAK